MMRLASPAFLRRAAVISSYGRGGYPRRGYSDHPSLPPHPGAGVEFVSGDSHQQQPYGQGPHQQPPYEYNGGYGYSQPQQPGPLYGTVPLPLPSNYSHPPPPGPQQYGYGAPNPYFQGHSQPHGRAPGNDGFRPGAPQLPRLADYRRKWLYAKQPPPHQAERFSVLSYKILADYLSQKNRHLYKRIPNYILDWNWRKDKLAFEFGLWNPDVLCLQEIDKFTDLEQELAGRGYSGTWKMRTGNAIDGCAIFWRMTRFQLRHEEDIEFNKLGLRDNVAQICVLESVIPRNPQTDSHSHSHPLQAKQIVVCNTHVLYNPRRGEIKLGQVRTLLDRAYTVSKMWNNAPVILCGGFNCIPKSPMYNFLSEQKLNLSGLTKPAISGQHTSAGLRGLYTSPNVSRSHPSFNTTNGKEGNIAFPNGSKLQTETIKMVENSSPAGNGPVFADASSESRKTESSNCCGNTTPCSGSTNLDKQELLSYSEGPGKDCYASDADAYAKKAESEEGTPIDKSSEWCTGMIKTESGEKPEVTGVSFAPATECGGILESCSSEIVNSTHLRSSDESFGLKDSLEELEGDSKKVSYTDRDLPCGVVPEEFTCASEGNGAQSDELLPVSEDYPDEKERALESMLPGQDNCATNELESCNSSAQSSTYALHQMSNVSLEGDSNTEATHLESREEAVHRSNGSVSDDSGNHCSTGVVNKHSISSTDETTTNEVFCTDVNSDPTFFEELTGANNSLLDERDQLPDVNSDPTFFKEVTSDNPPSLQKTVSSNESYCFYDPYTWTPDDLRTATGKEDCTYVEHNLKLRSVYTDVEDSEGTKDANKEPLVTSTHGNFMGTLDYIWVAEDLQTVRVLDTFPKEILNKSNGFPTKKWGSDHISLVCELAFTK